MSFWPDRLSPPRYLRVWAVFFAWRKLFLQTFFLLPLLPAHPWANRQSENMRSGRSAVRAQYRIAVVVVGRERDELAAGATTSDRMTDWVGGGGGGMIRGRTRSLIPDQTTNNQILNNRCYLHSSKPGRVCSVGERGLPSFPPSRSLNLSSCWLRQNSFVMISPVGDGGWGLVLLRAQ